MEQPKAQPEIERDESRGVLVVRQHGRTAELPLDRYDAANPYQKRVMVRNAVLAQHDECPPEGTT